MASPATPLLEAQPPTAELSGTVHDAGHAPMAGVTVELACRKLHLEQATGPDGSFHFCCLPPGRFDITFRHKGVPRPGAFALELSPPKRYRVSAGPQAGSSGEWTLREEPSGEGIPETSTRTYTRPEIEGIPSTLHLWTLVGHTEVSTTADRFDIAGMHSDETMLFGSRGGSWSQNRIALSGFNLTGADGARTLLVPDLSTLESVTYRAVPEGISLPGAELLLQPRQGGPTHHGEAHLFFQGGALQSVNVTPRQRSFGITESDERYRYFLQGNGQWGGPLSSNWAYYGAVSRQQAEKRIRNHQLPVSNALTSETANLTGDVSSRDRLGLTWLGQQWHQPEESASPQISREATRDTTRTYQGLQGFWTRTVSPRSLLDTRMAFSFGKTGAALQPGTNQLSREERFPSSVDIPFVPSAEGGKDIVALLNNVRTGAAPLAGASRDWRLQALLHFQTSRDGPGTSSHRLSFGVDAQWLRTEEQARAFENINQRFFRGEPDSVQLLNEAGTRSGSANVRSYAADDIRIGPLTFSVSGQAGWAEGSNRRTAGPRGDRLGWGNAGGQAAVGYRVGERYPMVLRAALAHRYQESLIRSLKAVHPDGLGILTYSWDDSNRDGSFQPGELGSLLKAEGAPFSRLGPRLKQPFTREVHLEAAQALPWELVVSLHAFRRVEHRLLAFVNAGVPLSAYRAVQVFDPGDDGASQTGDEALLVAYNQDPATLGRDDYVLANPPDPGAFAEGYEGRVSRGGTRLRWELAVTQYRAAARTAPGNEPRQNDWSVFAVSNDPNQSINAYGSTYFDRGLAARFWGTCQFIWGTRFSWIASFLDGAPYGRVLPVTGLNQGLIGILATLRGPGDGRSTGGKRTAHNLTTDLRLSRRFPLSRGRLDATLDVFNLFNEAYALRESDVTSPTHYWRIPLTFQTPRSLQLGLRFGW